MNPFKRVTPDPDQAAMMAGLGRKLESLYEDIAACVPDGDYKTEALKALTSAGMWANKGITHGSV
jgi:hypothetical protein